jgi:polyisoprenoid-binding protein YceI
MQIHEKHDRKQRYLTLIGLLSLVIVAALANTCPTTNSATRPAATYIIDNQKGKFIAHAFAGGLFSFKGHDHYLAARDYSGEVELNPDGITPASLHLVVKSGSLEETGTIFTEEQKKIINKEVHDLVLLPDKYPDIVFQSTGVTAKPAAAGQYDVAIVGNLTLLGVTRQETIPVKLSLTNSDLQAVGQFSIDRDDYKVKATSAFHGLVRVQEKVRFEFDIVAHRR